MRARKLLKRYPLTDTFWCPSRAPPEDSNAPLSGYLVPIAYAPASLGVILSPNLRMVPIAYAPERKTPPSVRFLTNGAHRARARKRLSHN